MAAKRSAVFKYFSLQEDGITYVCNIENSEGGTCNSKFSVKREDSGSSTRCFNLKRHLERAHSNIHQSVKQEDDALKKPRMKEPDNQGKGITSYFKLIPTAVKVDMTRENFLRGIIELVVYQLLPFSHFKSQGFVRLNGQMANSLNVCLDRQAVRKYVLEEAERRKQVLKNEIADKLIFVKLDAATRLRKNYLGVNIQFFAEQ